MHFFCSGVTPAPVTAVVVLSPVTLIFKSAFFPPRHFASAGRCFSASVCGEITMPALSAGASMWRGALFGASFIGAASSFLDSTVILGGGGGGGGGGGASSFVSFRSCLIEPPPLPPI